MFNHDTVFILGAGASWHYGYPLGETLVRKVIEEAGELACYYRDFQGLGQVMTMHAKSKAGPPGLQYQAAEEDCRELKKRLHQLNPPVIDYFLGDNQSVREIGQILVALVILKAEATFAKDPGNPNRAGVSNDFRGSDDWCRFINYQLTVGCQRPDDLFRNKVSFVTFNYDTSLERQIHNGLSVIEKFGPSAADEFLSDCRINHVYGRASSDHKLAPKIESRPERNRTGLDAIQHYVDMINAAHDASRNMTTIADEKGDNGREVVIARSQLDKAQRVYILGYGFDPTNNSVLELEHILPGKKRVCFTNLGDSNRINKRVSRLIFKNDEHISSQTPLVSLPAERSIRNVYDALALDFDLE